MAHQRVDAVHFRHLQVHEGDVRMVSPKLLDRLAASGRLSHQRHIRLNGEQAGDPFAHQRMIIDHRALESLSCRRS